MRYKLINLHTFYISKLIFKTLKANHKRLLKIFLFVIIVVGYILGFAIIFNLKSVLGIGNYDDSKSITIPINDGSGGIYVELYAHHRSQLYHDYGYTLTAVCSGDVNVIGMSYLDYRIKTGGTGRQSVDINLTTPIRTISWDGYASIRANQNFTIQGFADVIFLVNSENVTQRIPIDFGIIIELDGEQINYEWGNISTWLNVIYLSFTVLPATLLYRNIKAYKFEKWYSDELKERDQNFFKILSKESEE